MKIKYTYLILPLLISVLVSCTNNLMNEASSNRNITDIIQKNYLEFKDLKEFKQALFNDNFNPKELNPNFISMQDIIDSISSTKNDTLYNKMLKEYFDILEFDDDLTPHLKIKDPALTRLINPEGIVKIADKFYYVDDKFLKIVSEDNFNYEKIKKATKSDTNITIYESPTTKIKYQHDFIQNRYKVHLVKFYRNYGVWCTIGADATHYERYHGRWVKDKTIIYLKVQWSSFSYIVHIADDPPFDFQGTSGSKDKEKRTKSLHVTYYSAWYVGTPPIPTYSNYTVSGLKASFNTHTGLSGSF